MNCAEFESILADYLDGTLAGEERAAVEGHAQRCAGCREFMAEVSGGLGLLERVGEVEPPPELITRLAYLAPLGRTRDPFEQQSWTSRMFGKWVLPILQPRLAMGMAMTILSFAMLRQCTGVDPKQIGPADLSPTRVLGGVEDKALRARDQVVKYYDNLRIVYEIETHVRDLQEEPATAAPASQQSKGKESGAARPAGSRAAKTSTGQNAPGKN